MRSLEARALGCAALLIALGACAPARSEAPAAPPAPGAAARAAPGEARSAAKPAPRLASAAFLDTLERRTFEWFWDLSDSVTGLTPDRWPTQSFVSVGATGFALTAYPIGAERGWVSRPRAAARVLATLRFLWQARQDTAYSGATGYRGFFYHFLDPKSGTRFEDVELSTMDSALLLAGVLSASPTSSARAARSRRSARQRNRSTRAPTGTGRRRGRPRSRSAGIRGADICPTTGAATTRP